MATKKKVDWTRTLDEQFDELVTEKERKAFASKKGKEVTIPTDTFSKDSVAGQRSPEEQKALLRVLANQTIHGNMPEADKAKIIAAREWYTGQTKGGKQAGVVAGSAKAIITGKTSVGAAPVAARSDRGGSGAGTAPASTKGGTKDGGGTTLSDTATSTSATKPRPQKRQNGVRKSNLDALPVGTTDNPYAYGTKSFAEFEVKKLTEQQKAENQRRDDRFKQGSQSTEQLAASGSISAQIMLDRQKRDEAGRAENPAYDTNKAALEEYYRNNPEPSGASQVIAEVGNWLGGYNERSRAEQKKAEAAALAKFGYTDDVAKAAMKRGKAATSKISGDAGTAASRGIAGPQIPDQTPTRPQRFATQMNGPAPGAKPSPSQGVGFDGSASSRKRAGRSKAAITLKETSDFLAKVEGAPHPSAKQGTAAQRAELAAKGPQVYEPPEDGALARGRREQERQEAIVALGMGLAMGGIGGGKTGSGGVVRTAKLSGSAPKTTPKVAAKSLDAAIEELVPGAVPKPVAPKVTPATPKGPQNRVNPGRKGGTLKGRVPREATPEAPKPTKPTSGRINTGRSGGKLKGSKNAFKKRNKTGLGR